jgi:hypothetical protein
MSKDLKEEDRIRRCGTESGFFRGYRIDCAYSLSHLRSSLVAMSITFESFHLTIWIPYFDPRDSSGSSDLVHLTACITSRIFKRNFSLESYNLSCKRAVRTNASHLNVFKYKISNYHPEDHAVPEPCHSILPGTISTRSLTVPNILSQTLDCLP